MLAEGVLHNAIVQNYLAVGILNTENEGRLYKTDHLFEFCVLNFDDALVADPDEGVQVGNVAEVAVLDRDFAGAQPDESVGHEPFQSIVEAII